MADNNKYSAPDGPPPNYNKPVHQDAGPYYGGSSQSPAPFQQDPRDQYGYGSPAPQGQGQWNQQPPQQNYYPPQGGYYQPQQQQGMYYGQQPPYGGQQYSQYGQPYGQPAGYYGNQRSGGAGEGLCAGLLAALTCCCCLDFLF